ncbi:hypothetical protein MMC07_007503 [Pseudocyphellaria aurata]|nr:hypothetical protein [Pseudocyphellaria aurata]
METSEDKLWASRYLLDPLTAPEPSQETGPGTHHNTTSVNSSRPQSSGSSAHNQTTSPRARHTSGGMRTSISPPPAYKAPRQDRSSHREHLPASGIGSSTQRNSPSQPLTITPASTGGQSYSQRQSTDRASTAIPTSTTGHSSHFSGFDDNQAFSQRQSTDRASTAIPTSTTGRSSHISGFDDKQAFSQRSSTAVASVTPSSSITGRPRSISLRSRFDGDQSHRPLEIIKRDTQLANRAPHLRKKHHVGADAIDVLDTIGGGYHHGGPFDATLLARNTAYKSSPIAAVRDTNSEALKATPREMVYDSIRAHRPLDGVAMVPPGELDRNGQIYHYEETNLMVEDGGDYKRWPGVTYLPTDIKGKGEPSYSLEKALKENETNSARRRRVTSEGANAIELTNPRPRAASSSALESNPAKQDLTYSEWEGNLSRTSGRNSGGLLRRGFRSHSRAKLNG